MKDTLKKYYWKIESLIYGLYTRYLMIIRKGKKHSLSKNLIVTLTSYPPRFATLHLTIKCLLNQSCSPEKVILWVARDDYALLPKTVLKLAKRYEQFEIKKTEDLKSYKKLIPALVAYPNSFLVTADDDIYYPAWWLEKLISEFRTADEILTYRAHAITYELDGKPKKYNEWNFNNKTLISGADYFATGVGGVLYPPGSLSKQVLDNECFMKLAPKADDVWFFWMAKLNGTKVKKIDKYFNIICWNESQEVALAGDNVAHNENDLYISNMIDKFGWPTDNHEEITENDINA